MLQCMHSVTENPKKFLTSPIGGRGISKEDSMQEVLVKFNASDLSALRQLLLLAHSHLTREEIVQLLPAWGKLIIAQEELEKQSEIS